MRDSLFIHIDEVIPVVSNLLQAGIRKTFILLGTGARPQVKALLHNS